MTKLVVHYTDLMRDDDVVGVSDVAEALGLEILAEKRNWSVTTQSPPCDPLVKGPIFSKWRELVCPPFPHAYDAPEGATFNVADYRFFVSHEGTLIRVFHCGTRWHIATNRKLNAFESKWGSVKSFGILFKDAISSEIENNPAFAKRVGGVESPNVLDKLYSLLDMTKQYMFFLRSTADNRLACNPPSRPTVYHVCTTTICATDTWTVNYEDDIGIPHVEELTPSNAEEVEQVIQTVDPLKTQGLLIVSKTQPAQIFKKMNPMYAKRLAVRGNDPSLRFRYISLFSRPSIQTELREMFPEKTGLFDSVDKRLFEKTHFIAESYNERYIERAYIRINKVDYYIMKLLREKMGLRSKEPVDRDNVYSVLAGVNAPTLNNLLKSTDEVSRQDEEDDY